MEKIEALENRISAMEKYLINMAHPDMNKKINTFKPDYIFSELILQVAELESEIIKLKEKWLC